MYNLMIFLLQYSDFQRTTVTDVIIHQKELKINIFVHIIFLYIPFFFIKLSKLIKTLVVFLNKTSFLTPNKFKRTG
jgi:hypothetical protein